MHFGPTTYNEIISDNILAFNDIYEYLESSTIPVNEEEILNYLKDNFDIEWTTFAQVTFRFAWLMNLGKVIKLDSGYTVWDNIEYLGNDYYDANFPKLARGVLGFLITSLMLEENIDVGTTDHGSVVAYNIFSTDKRLELILENKEYLLHLNFFDNFEEKERDFTYKLSQNEILELPFKIKSALENKAL